MSLDPLLYRAVADAAARMHAAHDRDREAKALHDAEGAGADRTALARLAHLATEAANRAEDEALEALLVAGLDPDAHHYTRARFRSHQPAGVVVGNLVYLAIETRRWPNGVREIPDSGVAVMSLFMVPVDRIAGMVVDPKGGA